MLKVSRSRDLGHAPFWPIFLLVNLQAKLEVCIFSRSVTLDSPKISKKSRDLRQSYFNQFFIFSL